MNINPSFGRRISTAFGAVSAVALITSCSLIDNATYRQDSIKTCLGQVIKVGDMENQLKLAGYRGILDKGHINEELMAFNNAACGGIVNTCNGEMYWLQVDTEVHNAGYDGKLNHSRAEVAAYNRAACPEKG